MCDSFGLQVCLFLLFQLFVVFVLLEMIYAFMHRKSVVSPVVYNHVRIFELRDERDKHGCTQ